MLTQLSPSILTQPNARPTQFLPTTHPTHFSPNRTQPNAHQNVHRILTQLCYHSCPIVTHSHPIETNPILNQCSPNYHPIITQYSHPTMPNTQLLTRPIFHTIEPNPILIKILTQFSPNCNMIISQYSSFFPHIHVILTKI